MKELAITKVQAVTRMVTADDRWNLEDELMCQVFGFTLFGYAFGVGRIVCFLDAEDIIEIAVNELVGLGIGPKYAQGLVENAYSVFFEDQEPSTHSQLAQVGHSHYSSENLTELVDSIFENTDILGADVA